MILRPLLLLALFLAAAPCALADTLIAQGRMQHESRRLAAFDESIVGTTQAGFTLRLFLGDSVFPSLLFGDLLLDSGDVGSTFTADASDPGFAAFASDLTDGTAHKLLAEFWLGGYGAGGGGGGLVADQEIDGFTLLPLGGTPPDLAGFSIGRVEVRVDSLSIQWSSPVSVETSFSATYSVYGLPVPVPPSVWLMASGLVTLLGYRRLRA